MLRKCTLTQIYWFTRLNLGGTISLVCGEHLPLCLLEGVVLLYSPANQQACSSDALYGRVAFMPPLRLGANQVQSAKLTVSSSVTKPSQVPGAAAV